MESEVTDLSGQREALLPINHKKLLTISEKRRIAKLRKKGKFWFKLHYECDRLIATAATSTKYQLKTMQKFVTIPWDHLMI